ncbi:MAG: hypothetical protein LBD27_03770 [Tannerella sp.]|jgi:hypothetical protein|nr:hypothetical protein [Tannerella sp.]
MGLDFDLKDVIHRVIVKFVPAWLPGAKKNYYAKAVLQPELDIQGVASKASVYNITTPPKVIEEGFNAAVRLITCLTQTVIALSATCFILTSVSPASTTGRRRICPPAYIPKYSLRRATCYAGIFVKTCR